MTYTTEIHSFTDFPVCLAAVKESHNKLDLFSGHPCNFIYSLETRHRLDTSSLITLFTRRAPNIQGQYSVIASNIAYKLPSCFFWLSALLVPKRENRKTLHNIKGLKTVSVVCPKHMSD